LTPNEKHTIQVVHPLINPKTNQRSSLRWLNHLLTRKRVHVLLTPYNNGQQAKRPFWVHIPNQNQT